MKTKFFPKCFCVLLFSLLFILNAYGGDILIHDGGLEKGVIYRVSPNGTNLKRIGEGILPQWSPSKKFISYVKNEKFDRSPDNRLVVVNTEGQEMVSVGGSIDNGLIANHAWDPTGEGIALIRFGIESSVSYLNIKTKKMKILHKIKYKNTEDIFCSTLEWSPDGKRLLFSQSPGSIDKWEGADLIDLKQGTVKKVSKDGYFPTLISRERLLFVRNSEIWMMNMGGGEKRKICDIEIPIIAATREAKGKIVFLAKAKDLPGELPARLFLLHLETNWIEEINTQGYLFMTPAISSEGNKIAAIGVKLKNGDIPDGEECYYVYDLKTKEVTLLKKIDVVENHRGLGFLILFGFKPIIWN